MKRFLLLSLLLLALARTGSQPGAAAQDTLSQSGYYTYPEIIARLKQLETEHPTIAQAVNLNQVLRTPMTVEGRALWALKISDNATNVEDEPAVIVDGLHHARELMTPHAVLDIAEQLLGQYGTNSDMMRWVDHYEIWLIPCVNPDGLVHIFSQNRNWRKNRRPNGDGTFGVDLNRNYPFAWGKCGSTSVSPSSDTYRGPSPASEPEVQTLLALGALKRPVLYLSYHSSGDEVLYPYRCAQLAELTTYYAVRDEYAAAMRFRMRLASASGESFEHFYNQFGSLAFLTEIGQSFQPPFTQVPPLLERLRPGWQYLLNRAMGPSIYGHVKNARTGEPLRDASVSIDGIVFTEGEVRKPEPTFGRFHWIVQPGVYIVRVSAPGFQPQSQTVMVTDKPVALEIKLVPNGS